MAEVITEQAKLHNIDPLLIVALIQVESNFKDKALSNKGAKGLMQLLPDTAAYIHAKNDNYGRLTHIMIPDRCFCDTEFLQESSI